MSAIEGKADMKKIEVLFVQEFLPDIPWQMLDATGRARRGLERGPSFQHLRFGNASA